MGQEREKNIGSGNVNYIGSLKFFFDQDNNQVKFIFLETIGY